jgi:hypothetical protein
MTASGEIKVEWRRELGKVRLVVVVPPGTSAVVRLPGLADMVQNPGKREYTVVL